MYRIMIIEDQANIRQELKQLLGNALYEVCEITRFEGIVTQILQERPDLILLDMNLPGEDGIMICTQLRRQSDIPVIFVTGNNTSMDELNCIMQGGDDYIAKPYQAPILLARIAAVLKRCVRNSERQESRISYRGVTLDVAAGMVYVGDQKKELTKNELKILYYLFENQGKIIPRADLIEYLWDNQVFIDDNTLSVNITRLRTKLEQLGVIDFIETKRGMGYKV